MPWEASLSKALRSFGCPILTAFAASTYISQQSMKSNFDVSLYQGFDNIWTMPSPKLSPVMQSRHPYPWDSCGCRCAEMHRAASSCSVRHGFALHCVAMELVCVSRFAGPCGELCCVALGRCGWFRSQLHSVESSAMHHAALLARGLIPCDRSR